MWIADCMQFLSENCRNGCQIFGQFRRFGYFKTETELIFGFVHTPCVTVNSVVCCIGRVKKKEKDREELWQKLDDLHVSAGVAMPAVMASTVNSKSPET